jgi:hypothetical protein
MDSAHEVQYITQLARPWHKGISHGDNLFAHLQRLEIISSGIAIAGNLVQADHALQASWGEARQQPKLAVYFYTQFGLALGSDSATCSDIEAKSTVELRAAYRRGAECKCLLNGDLAASQR